MTNAEHIFNWARCDALLYRTLTGARAYPDSDNFTTARALALIGTATAVLRDMRKSGEQVSDYLALDVLKAACIMAEWDGES
jgi:hypothetical protein